MGAGKPDGIFISYRRSDAPHAAGRLADALERTLGEARVFRDLHDIAAGQDFAQVLGQALDGCGTMLVLIGPQWLVAREADGPPRLHEDGDWVRHEIESALGRGLRVIPVLLELASLPAASALPPSLGGLLRLQAFRLMDSRWDRDVADLVALLQPDAPLPSAGAASGPVRAGLGIAGQAASIGGGEGQSAAGGPTGLNPPSAALPVRLALRLWRWVKRAFLALGVLVVGSIVLAVTCTGDTPSLAGDWHSANGWQLRFQSLGPSKISTQAQYRVTGRFAGQASAFELDCHGDQVIASVKLSCQAVGADGKRLALRCDALRFNERPATLRGDCLWQPDDTVSRVELQRR